MAQLDREKIRKAYREYGPVLSSGFPLSPYDIGVDWITAFSPIEDNVWAAIRYLGLPLYPQFPVGQYFIDFADPYRKIGIEVDSKQWHKDKVKDWKRQGEIEKEGWRIYRIPSWMTYKNRENFQDENGVVDVKAYVEESAEGFLHDIYHKIFKHEEWLKEIGRAKPRKYQRLEGMVSAKEMMAILVEDLKMKLK